MASSLHDLLLEEGFDRTKNLPKTSRKPPLSSKPTRHPKLAPDDSIALPIYICHDRRNSSSFKHRSDKPIPRKASAVLSSKWVASDSERANSKSLGGSECARRDGPAIDEVAIRAVVSILSGFIGRYLKDEAFRESLREKCYACLKRRKKEADNGVLANMELGIESIEQLILGGPQTRKELRMKSLENSVRLLSVVASVNSGTSRSGSTSGIPNSHLSACSQLYLSIVYKLEKNDRISARHLLQVFCDAPFLARTYLLPDLWEHFFLPHLLHLKVWYVNELEFLSNQTFQHTEKRIMALRKIYDNQMDMGTRQFAFYYKEWLKVGAQAPAVPSVPLPSRPSYGKSRRQSSDSFSSNPSVNRNL